MSDELLDAAQPEDIPYAIGRYRLVHKVAEGATGVVYLAVDTGLGREVAVKLLHAVAETREDETSARECSPGDFSHPNLVRVYDRGEENEHPYVVMEWLEGETLKTTLGRSGSVPVDEARRIVAEVGKAVASAHPKGLAHGDIKPGNVFLCRSGQVKLLDLGLTTQSEDVDPWWDIFSLGSLLDELAPPSSGPATDVLVQIARRAMAMRVDDRYPAVSDMVSDLEQARRPREVAAVAVAS